MAKVIEIVQSARHPVEPVAITLYKGDDNASILQAVASVLAQNSQDPAWVNVLSVTISLKEARAI
jgi:hypothetical protein